MRKCHKASIAYRVPAPGVVREASEGARRGRAAPSTAPTTLDADGTGEIDFAEFTAGILGQQVGENLSVEMRPH